MHEQSKFFCYVCVEGVMNQIAYTAIAAFKSKIHGKNEDIMPLA